MGKYRYEGEIWGDMGDMDSYGEIWTDMGRDKGIWGDMDRYGTGGDMNT